MKELEGWVNVEVDSLKASAKSRECEAKRLGNGYLLLVNGDWGRGEREGELRKGD